MNKRQAKRRIQAAEYERRIEQLAWMNMTAAKDIQAYVACIHGTVDGQSICEWCEDYEECQLDAKGGKGCTEWWLRFPKKEEEKHEEDPVTLTGPIGIVPPTDGDDGGGMDPVPAEELCGVPSEPVEGQ